MDSKKLGLDLAHEQNSKFCCLWERKVQTYNSVKVTWQNLNGVGAITPPNRHDFTSTATSP